MKKQTIILASIALIAALSVASGVAAQTMQASSSAQAEINTGGGLGKGINHMVRSILGDTDEQSAQETPQVQTMMLMSAEADMSAPAPANLMVQGEALDQQSTTMNANASFKSARLAAAPHMAVSEDDVTEFMHGIIENDPQVVSIDAADGHVRIAYATRAKFLGLFGISAIVRGSVQASGETSLTYPWFARIPGVSAATQTAFSDRMSVLVQPDGFTAEVRMNIIADMHAFLQSEFGTNK